MHDQTNPPGVAAELDRTEHAVLCLLMDPGAPDLWSVAEVAQALGNEFEAVDALVSLHAAGLIHRCHEFVFVTRPTARLTNSPAVSSETQARTESSSERSAPALHQQPGAWHQELQPPDAQAAYPPRARCPCPAHSCLPAPPNQPWQGRVRPRQQVEVLEQLSGAQADLLGADWVAALDLDEEALACVFEGEVELRLPATR